ncbi:DUF927 domain-containing protein [Vibrio diabolicus]
MYRNKNNALEYCDKEEGWVAISSELSVVARVRAQDKKSGYGACIEFVNMDLVPVRLVVPANRILGSSSNVLREELFDRGFWLEDEKYNWGLVLRYLRQEIKQAPTGISAFNTGWHGDVFVTTETTFGAFEEPYFYAGEIVDSNFAVKGSLDHWQQEIGCLLSGNPTLIFSVGVALAAPLLAPSGGESSVFHLMGSSSQGKSGAIYVGSSVYGSHSYKKTWYSTNNGIESVSVNYNDVMLPLDEIGMARSENLDTAAYQIVNGDGKLRMLITGALGKQAKWRTLVLSTGEVGLIDLLEEIGKKPAAGQLVRIVEIPLTEKYGCFSSIHRFNDSHEFAKHLEEATKKYHGSLFPAWMCLIVKQPDLELLLRSETDRLMQRWKESCMSAQVLRVLHRFCLVAVALSLASRHKLVPWSEEESLFSVHSIFQRWIAARGHTQNHEEFEVLLALKQALSKWEKQLSEVSSGRASSTGYYRQDGDEVQWLIHKNVFIRDLQLRKQYISQLTPLVQRRWFESNEGARGTLRVKVNGKLERFFAFTPSQIIEELEELTADA